MTSSSPLNINFKLQERDSLSQDTPVVLLLGWAGCQDKYLQKYSKIYEDKGYITIRYSAVVSHVFWDKSGMIDTADKIVKFIYDKKLESHPIFIHAFSNGGAFLFEHISLKFQQAQNPIKIKGLIFDSAPGERRIGSLFRVMQEIFGKTPVLGPILATIIFSTLLSLYLLQLFYYKTKEMLVGYTPGSDPYNALLKDKSRCPQLIFYSKKDHLVSYMDVEYYAKCRENLGNQITKICFEDSLHVKHFMAHPEIYQNSVQKFMETCLTLN